MTHDPLEIPNVLPASADYCAVSTATRLLGDRWSLLLVREVLLGNTRYSEIQGALPGLSRGMLASRLGYLTRLGILVRCTADGTDHRVKYTYGLTDSGRALIPVLAALGDWASRWSPPPPAPGPRGVGMDLEQLRSCFEPAALPSERVRIQFQFTDAHPAWLGADRTGVRACHGTYEGETHLVVRSSIDTLNRLYWGTRTCRDALARHDIILDGPAVYTRAFADWFPHRPAVIGPSAKDDPVDDRTDTSVRFRD